ncbi:MAG: CNNM domain-containing protein, partial [Pseudomonadota bacterium]
MEYEIIWLFVIVIFVLLVFSGLFSASETAFTAASRARIHYLTKRNNRRALIVEQLLDRPEHMVSAILIANNMTNTLASTLSAALFIGLYGEAGIAYATLVMTVLIVIFAEILPKSAVLKNPDRVVLVLVPFLYGIRTLFLPVVKLIIALKNIRLARPSEQDTIQDDSHIQELHGVIDLHDGDNPASQQERRMLRSVLDLSDATVNDVMTHRKAVEMINLNDSADILTKQILESPHTRFPIYRDDHDNIIGVVHAKMLLKSVLGGKKKIDAKTIETLAIAPWFIPFATDLMEQLEAFRRRREHFALVIDEYGSFDGIVTLEDILEQIVGEIDDEHDIAQAASIARQTDGSYVIAGAVTIRELNTALGWHLPEDGASTVGGLVLYQARR